MSQEQMEEMLAEEQPSTSADHNEQMPTTSTGNVEANEPNEAKNNQPSGGRKRREKYYMETLGVEDVTYGFTELGYGTTNPVKRTRDVLLKPMLFDCGCIEPPPKIAILGAKETGMALTAALLSMNIAYNIAICELNEKVAEIADIETCIMGPNIYGHGVSIYTDLQQIAGASIVVITRDFAEFGYNGRAEFTDAIETIQNNLSDMFSLVEAVCQLCPDAIIVNHVYPTELTTRWAYMAASQMKPPWNPSRLIGLGTAVHSARFRRGLAAKLGVSPADCEAVILGREGKTSVPIWSSVSVAGVKLQDLNEDIGTDEDEDNYVLLHIDSAGMDELLVRHRGEPANYAPAVIMARLVYAILHNTREVFTICTFVKGCRHGEKQDVFMSLPCVIGRTGVQRIVKQRMSETEKDAMQDSAQQIYDYYVQFETGKFVIESTDGESSDEDDNIRRKKEMGDRKERTAPKCIVDCTCADLCPGKETTGSWVCVNCCGGRDECPNSRRHRSIHKSPKTKFRGSGEYGSESAEIWKDRKDADSAVIGGLSHADDKLKAVSRFQRSIEPQESAACQSDIPEDCLVVQDRIKTTAFTYTGSST